MRLVSFDQQLIVHLADMLETLLNHEDCRSWNMTIVSRSAFFNGILVGFQPVNCVDEDRPITSHV